MAANGLTIAQLAAAIERTTAGRLAAKISGDFNRRVDSVAPLEAAGDTQLSFLANPRYRAAALASRAAAIVLDAASAAQIFPDGRADGSLIVCDAPYAWFALAAQRLAPAQPFEPRRADSARIAETAIIDATARVDELAVIEAGARVGPRAWIGAGS
ncbi:MAG: LpxD N-terminal domain-containing protein, partial [Pseudomonadota bacterium]